LVDESSARRKPDSRKGDLPVKTSKRREPIATLTDKPQSSQIGEANLQTMEANPSSARPAKSESFLRRLRAKLEDGMYLDNCIRKKD